MDVAIERVSIDASGRIAVRPEYTFKSDFAAVHRAGMEVSWDSTARMFTTPVPRQWSQARWFLQIVRAVKEECGANLFLTPSTEWDNVSDAVRAEIEASVGQS